MSLQRKLSVLEGRAMIRVRYKNTHELATIGVCPGCWNSAGRRYVLLKKLVKMGLEVVHKADTCEGDYKYREKHAPGCPYGKNQEKSWEKFSRVMRKYKKHGFR